MLQKTGTRRMVSHMPDFQKIVSWCGGKVIIVDTGISHAFTAVRCLHWKLLAWLCCQSRMVGGRRTVRSKHFKILGLDHSPAVHSGRELANEQPLSQSNISRSESRELGCHAGL